MDNNIYNEPRQDEPIQGGNPYGEPVQNPYVNKVADEYSYEEIPPTGQPNMDPVYNPQPNMNQTYGQPPQPQKTGLAVAALVLGIIAIVLSCFGINIIFAVVAIILGAVYLAKKQAARRGMAIAGLVLGIISIVVFILMVVLVVVFMFTGMGGLYGDLYTEIYDEMYYDILDEMY